MSAITGGWNRSLLTACLWAGTLVLTCFGVKASPALRFAVISDPHFYSRSLGTSGSAYQEYLFGDPNLIAESAAILDSAFAKIRQEGVQFLIITGDLTKNGELLNHILMAQRLARLERQGIEVYVVPGNHDINNPDSVRYVGDTTRRVANVNPKLFRAIYQRFGYDRAIATDASSLSYVAEPLPGVWLLAIDSCKYQNNLKLGYSEIGGKISPATMAWLLDVLGQAKLKHKRVVAMMHHGVNQHSLVEPLLFSEYLVDDWPEVSAQLAAAGLGVVFTGHYHGQDAAYPVDANLETHRTLCDVETGSLVQYPCAFRVATIDQGALVLKTRYINHINTDTGGVPFRQYANSFLRVHLVPQVLQRLEAMLSMSKEEAAEVAPLVIDALVANYAGDESPSADTLATIQGLLSSPDPRLMNLGGLLGAIWTDLAPSDNDRCVGLRPETANDIGRPNPCGTAGGGTPPVDDLSLQLNL